jgi:hypothetical protein
LAELLDKNPSFGPMEQMLIENHLHILHLAYYGWKRRMNPTQDQPASPTQFPVCRHEGPARPPRLTSQTTVESTDGTSVAL